jgi:methyltransferase (TIGR00027 family)
VPAAAVDGTALWTAAVRAAETGRPDRLFADPLAAVLAGPLAGSRRMVGGDNAYPVVRTRRFDDAVVAAAGDDDLDQVVLIGAGLDTRAFRLPLPPATHVFEIDRAPVLAYKERVLERAGRPGPRCRRTTVAADVGADWTTPLLAAGLRPDRPTLWLLEGTAFYLSRTAAERLLAAAAAHCPSGSRLAVDLFTSRMLTLPHLRQYAGHDDPDRPPCTVDEPASWLADCGWSAADVLTLADAAAHYGRRAVGPPARWALLATALRRD